MCAWTEEELKKIATTDDLHISPFREDGVTYGTPTWIWSVVVEKELYVRPYNGNSSRWHKAAMTQHAGRITAAGVTKEVTFDLAAGEIIDQIDVAYQEKYKESPYLQPMIESPIRAMTVRITPREI